MLTKRLAIFASGSGSNAENVLNYFSSISEIEVPLLVTNNPQAGVIERVKTFEIDLVIIDNQQAANGQFLVDLCQQYRIDFILLAGYLRMIPAPFIQAYPKHIINVHPSLLPKYGGKGMYGMHVHEAVWANKETKSGISIHFVNEEFDKGEIISQHEVSIEHAVSAKEIAHLVQELEHQFLPETVHEVLKK